MLLHRKFSLSVCVLCCVLLLLSCNKNGGSGQQATQDMVTKAYAESADDFPNPERGFYRYTETRTSAYSPLQRTQLEQWRGLSNADGGNYQVYSTLVFRYFIMDAFTAAPLSAAFLQAVQNDFAIARLAGVKLIPRFVYTTTVKAGACPEGFICPPYGDAPKALVIQHISQLKPILTAEADVIAVVQLGLIGTWGENYYTDYFGDASQNGQSKLLDNNWQDRREVIAALLDAVPKERMIQVRYPQLKQRFIYGINAAVSSPALTASEAFNGEDKSRIGFHNDCFLASADDYGTYEDYGNSTSPRQSANTVLRTFAQADGKYVAVGGETCDDTYSPQNDCEPAGFAETEMSRLHYSYLNCAYNNAVNNDWQTAGCMMSIRKKLGYRFVATEFKHPKEVVAGEAMALTLTVNNIGYASPFNARPVKLVFRNKSTGAEVIQSLDTDIRRWFTGVNKVELSVKPANLVAGTYELFLWMPDNAASISARPEYAIRLANTNVWEAGTGYNNLQTSIVVK